MKKILTLNELSILDNFNKEFGLNVDYTKGFYFLIDGEYLYIVAKDYYKQEHAIFDSDITEVIEVIAPEILDHFEEESESCFESIKKLSKKEIREILISLGLEEIFD